MKTVSSSIKQRIEEYLVQAKLKLAYQISTLFLIVFSVLTYAYYFDSLESFITMSVGVVISSICLLVLHYTSNANFVLYTYSISGVLVTSYALITFHETIHLADILWMLAAVSLAFFGLGKKWGVILLVYSLSAITYFIVFSLNTNILTVLPRSNYQLMALVMELVAGFGANIFILMKFINFYSFSERELMRINTELEAQNELIKIRDEEKTVLVKEVHHRVKNNLQIIISLLRTQSLELNDPRISEHFQESINRILVMSHIHSKLYKQDSLKNIQFSNYLNDLANDLIRVYGQQKEITISIDTQVEQIGMRSIVPLGLLFNELISNSLKYAFNEKPTGQITIQLRKNDNNYTIEYTDDGNWVEREEYRGFGLSLIETLTEQLDGSKILTTLPNKTHYIFELKQLDL